MRSPLLEALGFEPVAKPSDIYYTPRKTVEALFDDSPPPRSARVLDPCAGNGAILEVARERGYHTEAVELRAVEEAVLQRRADRVTIGDWIKLAWSYRPRPDAIVTNPPFSIAREIVEVSLGTGCPWCAFLLRCNTLGSSTWRKFWAAHGPSRLRMVKRPSFSADGKTDASDYLWALWIEGEPTLDLRPA